MDQTSLSLNHLTANLAKAEALNAEIDSILQSSGQTRESLITFVQPIDVPVGRSSRYDREELYKQVWSVPMREFASAYGVSESGLRKACTRLQIPTPGLGYWAKKAANQPVEPRPPLPTVQVSWRLEVRKTKLPITPYSCSYSDWVSVSRVEPIHFRGNNLAIISVRWFAIMSLWEKLFGRASSSTVGRRVIDSAPFAPNQVHRQCRRTEWRIRLLHRAHPRSFRTWRSRVTRRQPRATFRGPPCTGPRVKATQWP